MPHSLDDLVERGGLLDAADGADLPLDLHELVEGRPLMTITGKGLRRLVWAARRTIFIAVSPRMSGRLMSRSRRSGW